MQTKFNLASVTVAGAVLPALGIEDWYYLFPETLQQRYAGIRAVIDDWATAFPVLAAFADQCAETPQSFSRIAAGDATLALPLRFPNKLISVGANYSDHLREMGLPVKRFEPMPMFLMPPTTCMVGPGATVVKPRTTQQFDWEIELTVVIGARLKDVGLDEAERGIAGYTIVLDMTARDLLKSGPPVNADLVRGKSQDTMAPTGPVITPAAFMGNVQEKSLKLWVNGEIRQNGSTADMIVTIPEIVSDISKYVTLEPGDHITTGTPGGSGVHHKHFLKAGDKVSAEIEGIGRLEIEIVDPN